MPWLTWHYSDCKVGRRGRKSDVAVVRTVVSVRPVCARDVSGPPLDARSTSYLTTQQRVRTAAGPSITIMTGGRQSLVRLGFRFPGCRRVSRG
jgi:hypothetical protein